MSKLHCGVLFAKCIQMYIHKKTLERKLVCLSVDIMLNSNFQKTQLAQSVFDNLWWAESSKVLSQGKSSTA